MKKFEVCVQWLCEAESSGGHSSIAAPAAHQYQYVFHDNLMLKVVIKARSEPVFPHRVEPAMYGPISRGKRRQIYAPGLDPDQADEPNESIGME